MLKKILLSLSIPAVYLVLTSSGGGSTPAWQQENVSFPMMDIEINATMKEHDRQKEMRQKQIANATVETANRNQWNNFKEKIANCFICHSSHTNRNSNEQGNNKNNQQSDCYYQ